MSTAWRDVPSASAHGAGPTVKRQASPSSPRGATTVVSRDPRLANLLDWGNTLSLRRGSGAKEPQIIRIQFAKPTSTGARVDSSSRMQRTEAPGLKPPIRQMLIDIRAAWGMGVSQLARALRVERPTVYAWLESKNEPRADNRNRIEAIWDLSQRWARSGLPADAGATDRVEVHGQTIGELLMQTPLRFSMISSAIDRLAKETAPAMIRGRKGRQLAERFGRTESQEAVAQLDAITGRPFAEDL